MRLTRQTFLLPYKHANLAGSNRNFLARGCRGRESRHMDNNTYVVYKFEGNNVHTGDPKLGVLQFDRSFLMLRY